MKPGVEARVASARALGRILRGGAWSNVVVDAVSRSLSDDDRRLVRRLVFGTLRNLNRIDAGLDRHLARGLDATDTSVLDVLRIGAYEVTVGGGAHHGAVDSAVEAVREVGRPRASGLVNGVLRNVIRNRMEEPPIDDLAAKHGVAGWLVADLTTTLGSDGAAAFLASSETDAPRTARVRPGATGDPASTPTAIEDVVGLPPGAVADGCVIQDVASAAVVRALGDVTGTRVLDMAAAPGGKTLQIWDAGPDLLVASDVHVGRLVRAKRRLTALGFDGPWLHADGQALPFPDDTFDRVLLDAPCTGLGTLRRRPELRYRVNETEVRRLAAMQRRMLAEAHRVAAPGGRVVYSVCTVTRAETVDIAREFGGRAPDLPLGDAGAVGRLLTPHRDGSDGMFIALFGD